MRLLICIISGLFLCFCNTGGPVGLSGKPVKFFPEGLDTVLIDAEGTRLKISTLRDYRKLCAALLEEFGPSLPVNYNESHYNDVFYRWKAPQSFGVQGYEMEFIIFKQYQEFNFIQIYITDKQKNWLPIPPSFASHFQSLCAQYLCNEPIVMQPRRDMNMPGFSYLSAVVEYDSLDLHRSLDSLFDPYHRNARINFSINKLGEISALKVDAGPKAEVFLRQWTKTLNFPILIYDTYKDTAIYQVCWQDGISRSNYLLHIQKLIVTHTLPRDTTPFALAFVGDFFNSGDTIAIIPMPDTNLVHCYTLKSGVLHALKQSPINEYTEGIETFFEDMNFDGIYELVFTASPNMHGNIERTIYYWNQSTGSLECAGSLWGHMEKNSEKQEIWTSSGGAWYTDQVQTVFGWKAGKLIPKRQIRREPKPGSMGNQVNLVKYLVNPFFEQGKDTLIVRYRDIETDEHPKYPHFFDKPR